MCGCARLAFDDTYMCEMHCANVWKRDACNSFLHANSIIIYCNHLSCGSTPIQCKPFPIAVCKPLWLSLVKHEGRATAIHCAAVIPHMYAHACMYRNHTYLCDFPTQVRPSTTILICSLDTLLSACLYMRYKIFSCSAFSIAFACAWNIASVLLCVALDAQNRRVFRCISTYHSLTEGIRPTSKA